MNSPFPFWNECIEFCQTLIQTPSISGHEQDVARLVKAKMQKLSYDEVWTDRVGNVIGLLRGNGNKDNASICFTAHMDTVEAGDESEWEYPPFNGVIAGDFIHGRGASDLKGPLSTQVYLPELLKLYNVKHGDIYVIQVVQEEVSGVGSKCLDETLMNNIDYAINGEPTSNKIKIGHKGRVELVLRFKGISAHASMPELAENPIYDMVDFITQLKSLEMQTGDRGRSTATPTIFRTGKNSSNATPCSGTIVIDWRILPGETEDDLLKRLHAICPDRTSIAVAECQLTTYTQVKKNIHRYRLPFAIDRNHPLVVETVLAVSRVSNEPVDVSYWPFCTDCGCFSERGIPIIGFSPGEEESIHTSKEKINLNMMKDAMRCYPAIVERISNLPKRKSVG